MTQPYYQDDWVVLYRGDCLEITEWLAADVLVTDPPYGIAWIRSGLSRVSYADKLAGRYGQARCVSDDHRGIAGDEDCGVRDAALDLWLPRPAIVFGSLSLPPPDGVKAVGIYGKPPDSGQMSAVAGMARSAEAIYLLGEHPRTAGGRSAIFQTGARSAGGAGDKKNPTGLSKRHGHPHAKPQDVMEQLIMLTAGAVADPFAGSGSTLVAAKALGRHAIGVELEEKYCEIAARRLAQDVLDFTGEAS